MRRFFLLLAVPCTFWLVQACSDDDVETPAAADSGTADSGGGHDAGHGGHDAATPGEDAGLPPIKCTDEEFAANVVNDGGEVEIAFPKIETPVQYTNRCLTIVKGASVTFTGSFIKHPLEPAGGDQPNPLPYTNTDQPDDKLVVSLPNVGTFGYRCEYHPTNMYGAIRVVAPQ